MKVELILPIARLRGKINSKSPFYFKTVNGKTFVQRCPNRSTKAPTPAQTAAKQRFAAIAQIVARMKAEGSKKNTFRRWLHSDTDYLRAQGITPKTKFLPPQVVRYLCEKYDIEV